MSQLQFNILDKKQSDLFNKLKVFKSEAVLAGGTALGLQIGHRYSFVIAEVKKYKKDIFAT